MYNNLPDDGYSEKAEAIAMEEFHSQEETAVYSHFGDLMANNSDGH
jgi:hypothetical protein